MKSGNSPEKMELVIMHMSGAYFAEDFYRDIQIRDRKIREIDCRDIGGTRGYCDDQAKERLRERIADAPFSGIHFLDSGNYHYLSLLWLEKIKEPFSLVLFDHHPDMQRPVFGNITSCGGWVREALLTHPCLNRVYVAGVKPELLEQEGILTGVTVSGEKADFPVERVHVGLSGLWGRGGSGEKQGADKREKMREWEKEGAGKLRNPVYLSIDKDVLGQQDARCDWDQGEMSLEELFGLLDQIIGHCRILGVDICGENPESKGSGDVLVNNRCNRRLVQKLMDVIS